MATAIIKRTRSGAERKSTTSIAVQRKPACFEDRRVFVISTLSDRSWVVVGRDYLGVHQASDGPRYVLVGPEVSDDKLLRNLQDLSARYGVTLAQLQAARGSLEGSAHHV